MLRIPRYRASRNIDLDAVDITGLAEVRRRAERRRLILRVASFTFAATCLLIYVALPASH